MLRRRSRVLIGIWFTNDASTIYHYWRWFLDMAVKRKTVNTVSKTISSHRILLHMSSLQVFIYRMFWGLWMNSSAFRKAINISLSVRNSYTSCVLGLGGGGWGIALYFDILQNLNVWRATLRVFVWNVHFFNFFIFQLLELGLERRSCMDREKLISIH